MPVDEVKKWEDSSVEEKLEKLRNELMQMRYLSNRMSTIESNYYNLVNHQHGTDGRMLVPFNSSGAGLVGTASGQMLKRVDPLA